MQFKHPEILYALLLLIIPIIVHLFQLQRFVKIPFTNVKFLKKIEQQTRKSARLKKWLILATRMLAFTCLILAFSQPFLSKHSLQQNVNISIYLDNSFSMQAKGESGELLKTVAQQIIANTDSNKRTISLITNNSSYSDLDEKNLKNELISLQYNPHKLDLSTVLLQLNRRESNKTNSLNKNIIISDFQLINNENKTDFTNVNSPLQLLKTVPIKNNNVFIDSIFIARKTLEEITLNVVIKSTFKSDLNIPISLFDDTKLIGKTTAKFNNNNSMIVEFTIPSTTNFNGKITLIDDFLTFDNTFFFTISKPTKINVLSIGKESGFLAKIYTKNEFNFSTSQLPNLNYNNIQNQQLILLNEIDNIPIELTNSLAQFLNNGGNIVIIPSSKIDMNSYNRFFNILKIGSLKSKIENEHKITTINFDHPLINNVFEKEVTNFQYPTTSFYYESNFKTSSNIIELDNNKPFISSINQNNKTIYWVASSLNSETSNFTQSPLIVPVFYNFAKMSLNASNLYYNIQPNNSIDIATSIGIDEVLQVSNANTEFIPLQTIAQNKVTINLQDNIVESGFYKIILNDRELQTIALNYNRDESDLTYLELESLISNNKNIDIASSVEDVFTDINNQQKINWLFKWFLAFSVLFLFIEMLILKYFNI